QVVSMRERRLFRLTDQGMFTVADLSKIALHYTNDMVMDRNGRAYIGNFGFDLNGGESPRPTVLICVTPDGQTSIVADDLWFPNGSVISPDGRTLLVAESFGARISAFTIEPDGALSNRRVFASLDGLYPDGICLDAEGAVWVTCAGGHRVVRVAAN